LRERNNPSLSLGWQIPTRWPDPLNLSDVDCRHRNGISHLKRNFHFCSLSGCLVIGGANQDCSWNDASVHCHGDVILVRFFHMSSKSPAGLRTLESSRTVDPSVPDARAILENRLSDAFEFLRDSFAYPILFSEGYRCFCIWRGTGDVGSCQLSVVGCRLVRAMRFASGSNSDRGSEFICCHPRLLLHPFSRILPENFPCLATGNRRLTISRLKGASPYLSRKVRGC
jgi:hypothetical protein